MRSYAAAVDALMPQAWHPVTYKRYSAGTCRLYSRIDGEWLLVAKRRGDGPWCGVPNAKARAKAFAELGRR